MKDYKQTPLWDNQLPLEERLTYLINELTLEEKITCLSTGCPDIERLGIKASFMGGEAAHGIEARHDQAFNAGEPEPSTAFTQPIGMSGSFDRELIRECGRAVGEEARALFTRNGGGGLCRWAPTVDMERDPRWGRTEEAYGEDPYLTGEMASAYIQGMKGNNPFYIQCGATLKHFYANNIEKDRIKISSSIDMRNKYEYYLEPFRKTIEEGGAEAVMTAYNEINGVPAIVNQEVQEILKDTYGLPGHVVCDGGDFQQTVKDHQYFKTHAETVAYGLKAGVDCFTDDKEVVFQAAREAYEKGLITEEDINRSVRNSFRTRIRLGFFDGEGNCPYTGMGEEYINNREHQLLCAEMAKEAVVLLKNEKDILPILPGKAESLAVMGPLADVWYKDWYCGIPPYTVTPLEGIKKAYPYTTVTYESGLSYIYLTCNGRYVGLNPEGRLQLTNKVNAEIFLLTDWGCGSTTLTAKSNGKLVTLEEGSYLIKADKKEAFGWFIRESWTFTNKETGSVDTTPEEEETCYFLSSWNGRRVTADSDGYLVVIKTSEPAVGEGDDEKLTVTSHAVSEGEPVMFRMELVSDGLAQAAELAEKAEKAVVVIGSNPVINSKEEIDRTTLAIPPAQQKLVDRVLAANPDTVVVIVSNYPYTSNQLQQEVPGILFTPSGSQELGTGIGAVLSGNTSPGGRLPMTWYQSEQDLPAMDDYDIIQGKRTYQYFDKEVLYPFGFGLSYTTFAYEGLKVEQAGDYINVQVTVTNTGKAAGDEVVQLYVHKEASRVTQPVCQLKGFERIRRLAPGEARTVEFKVPCKELCFYDVISRSMLLENGIYTFMAGSSSRDIRLKESLEIKGQQIAVRNPFETTEAVYYDSYENCFIHKGAKEHTLAQKTCMIPGKPGDNPDFVDKSVKEKTGCELWYRDFRFDKQPDEIVLTVCPLEEGTLTIEWMEDNSSLPGQIWTIPVERASETKEFLEIRKELPKEPIQTGSLKIQIEGKIKLAGFYFTNRNGH